MTGETEPETATICGCSETELRSAAIGSHPSARQWATSAYSTLRPDGEKRTVASPPHQLARPAQSLMVDDVERKQRPPPLGAEPLKTCAAFHGGEVNETNRARGLLSDMQPYIGLRRSGPTKAHSACASAGYVGDIQRDWKSCSV